MNTRALFLVVVVVLLTLAVGSGVQRGTAQRDSTLYVFVRGADDLLYYKTLQGTLWTDWKSMLPPPAGAATENPVVIANGTRLDLFVRGQDRALWHRTLDNNQWSEWESLGGVLTSGPSAVWSHIYH